MLVALLLVLALIVLDVIVLVRVRALEARLDVEREALGSFLQRKLGESPAEDLVGTPLPEREVHDDQHKPVFFSSIKPDVVD